MSKKYTVFLADFITPDGDVSFTDGGIVEGKYSKKQVEDMIYVSDLLKAVKRGNEGVEQGLKLLIASGDSPKKMFTDGVKINIREYEIFTDEDKALNRIEEIHREEEKREAKREILTEMLDALDN